MAARETTTLRAAREKLGVELSVWVATQRATGSSWPKVRDALEAATDGVVAITHQRLQQMFGEADQRLRQHASAETETAAS